MSAGITAKFRKFPFFRQVETIINFKKDRTSLAFSMFIRKTGDSGHEPSHNRQATVIKTPA
jgi:hypothetical protein